MDSLSFSEPQELISLAPKAKDVPWPERLLNPDKLVWLRNVRRRGMHRRPKVRGSVRRREAVIAVAECALPDSE